MPENAIVTSAITGAGLPLSFTGVIIAGTVLLPEGIAAVRAAGIVPLIGEDVAVCADGADLHIVQRVPFDGQGMAADDVDLVLCRREDRVEEDVVVVAHRQPALGALTHDVGLARTLEELRVSLFAQELKTLFPVSVKRIEEQGAKVRV